MWYIALNEEGDEYVLCISSKELGDMNITEEDLDHIIEKWDDVKI